MSITGTIDSTDAKQVGRLSRVGTSAACGVTKAFPNVGIPNGVFSYDLYRFTNPGATDECVTIQTTSITPVADLFVTVYRPFFDPSNLALNYLNDSGGTGFLQPPQSIPVTIPAGASIEVVFMLPTNPAAATTYTFMVTGCTNSVSAPVSTVTLITTPTTTVFGDSVLMSAHVAPSSGGPTPTGTVNFRDGTTTLNGAPVTLNETGDATFSTTALSVGAHATLSAIYGGDGIYGNRIGLDPQTHTVNKANASAAVVSSQNPQFMGSAVTFTATVAATAPGAGTPTGTVTFLDGATTLGTGTLSSGQATFSTSGLAVGSHTITASYGGDGNFNTSTSGAVTQVVNAKLVSTTDLVSSANPQEVGQVVIFTATVSGAGTPSGTVTFFDGTSMLGIGMLVAGSASLPVTDLAVGPHAITALYSGDAAFVSSTSPILNQVISKATTALTLTATPSGSSLADQSVKFDATVSATFGGPPTGTVTFLDGATPIGTGNVVSGVASFTISTLALGTHTIAASYAGDGAHDASSTSISYTVNPIATSTGLTSSANPSLFGQAITLTSTVTAGGATPTGSVTFREGATTLGAGPAALNGSGVATLVVSNLSVGTHNLTAEFTGPAKFTGSVSGTLVQTVGRAGTATALVASSPGVVLGEAVTFTATVTAAAPGAGLPTGTVTFSEGSNVLDAKALDGSGQATFTTSSLVTGSHTITASYGGDGNFTASTSADATVVVGRLASSTSLLSSANPSTIGQSVTFTATVTGSGTPTGNVTFLDGGSPLGTVALSGGQAAFTATMLAPGTHTITAGYAGDGDFVPSASPLLTQVVGRATATISLAATPTTSVADQTVAFSVTVAATAGGPPTGGVKFLDGSTELATVALASGVALFSTAGLAVGAHTITATYLGDATHDGASATIMIMVNPIVTATTLVSSVSTTVFGQPTLLTATVIAPGVTPAGSVSFLDGSDVLGGGPVAIDASGVATLTVSALAVGTHSLTAQFSGPPKFVSSTSTGVSQSVGQASTAVTLGTSSSNVIPATTVTFIAVVKVTAPGAGTPTGNVTFYDGTTALGTTGLTGGFATLSASTLALGSHPITATYAGDMSFKTSTSSVLTEVVSKSAVMASLTATTTTPTYGQEVTFTVTVTASEGGTPTGMATFTEATTMLGTATLSAGGVGTLALHTLVAGSHAVTVQYGGDSLHAGGTTASLSLVVAKRSTTTTLVSAPNPSAAGASTTLTAMTAVSSTPAIAGDGSDLVPLDGTVTFKDSGTTIGAGNVTATGAATLATSALALGSHTLSVTYEGASNYEASTSAALTHQVTPATADGGTDGTAADAAADASADASSADARETATVDAGRDAGSTGDASADAGQPRPSGGCGCQTSDQGAGGAVPLLMFATALALAIRRKGRPRGTVGAPTSSRGR